MTAPYRVALSGDFRKPDGSPVYPDFDLEPLRQAANVEFAYLEPANPISADQIAGFDALILLGNRFAPESVPADGRMSIVARFGVGYDTVDVPTCTATGIALTITPDGVRRPVAVAIITMLLALTGKMFVKDKLTRQGPAGYAQRSDHMGVGLIGRTLASVGIGNIGAEMFRLPPVRHALHRARPVSADMARELGITLVDLETVFRDGDFVIPLPADAGNLSLRQCRAARADEAHGVPDQHRARPDRRSSGYHQSAGRSPHRRRRAGCPGARAARLATRC